MICDVCHGRGVVPAIDTVLEWTPCVECHGHGVVYCCEGEIEQPHVISKEGK